MPLGRFPQALIISPKKSPYLPQPWCHPKKGSNQKVFKLS